MTAGQYFEVGLPAQEKFETFQEEGMIIGEHNTDGHDGLRTVEVVTEHPGALQPHTHRGEETLSAV
jgi:hypothetical protein